MGANQNAPNDASVKILKLIAPSFLNVKDFVKLERIFHKIFFDKIEEQQLKRRRQL